MPENENKDIQNLLEETRKISAQIETASTKLSDIEASLSIHENKLNKLTDDVNATFFYILGVSLIAIAISLSSWLPLLFLGIVLILGSAIIWFIGLSNVRKYFERRETKI